MCTYDPDYFFLAIKVIYIYIYIYSTPCKIGFIANQTNVKYETMPNSLLLSNKKSL